MSLLCPQQATAAINRSFYKWGLPKRIKIDNGWPFIHPCHRDIPTLSLLWWVALGLEVIQNDPASPQQNGTVEGLQYICFRWANPSKYDSPQELQQALDQTGHFQRSIYQVPAKSYQTRLQLYPDLQANARQTDLAEQFDMSNVHQYLAEHVWQRTTDSKGTVHFMSQPIYIDYRITQQLVTITFDPIDKLWIVRDIKGQLLKTAPNKMVSAHNILQHAVL